MGERRSTRTRFPAAVVLSLVLLTAGCAAPATSSAGGSSGIPESPSTPPTAPADLVVCEASQDCRAVAQSHWSQRAESGAAEAVAVGADGQTLYVGWTAGGCVSHQGLTAEETSTGVKIDSRLHDATPRKGFVWQGGKKVYLACTTELEVGVSDVRLEQPLGGRHVSVKVSRVRRTGED